MESALEKDESASVRDFVPMAPAREKIEFQSNGAAGNWTVQTTRQLANWAYRITHWETWDWRIKYFLIAPAWIWFCLRNRSLWFFTTANPTLTFGGFDGESKKEMYAQLPPGSFPRSIFVSPDTTLEKLEQLVATNGFSYPFAVKPDIGKMGLMFRKIHSPDELRRYHRKMTCDYIIQEFISLPLEVSVFYYRFPGTETGTITGFIRKDCLEVVGDGKSTLWDLMRNYPPVRFRLEEMKTKHSDRLAAVIPEGQKYYFSQALNLSRGGRLVSLENQKDERLSKIFDDLSRYTGNFYYGRYDVKCASVEDLKNGNFCILEYNGSGAEPHHVYGNGYNLIQACGILVFHWSILSRISRLNRSNGVPLWDFRTGRNFLKTTSDHFKLLRKLDRETGVT